MASPTPAGDTGSCSKAAVVPRLNEPGDVTAGPHQLLKYVQEHRNYCPNLLREGAPLWTEVTLAWLLQLTCPRWGVTEVGGLP